MHTIRFQVVARIRIDRYRCGCGKRFQRTARVEQTINPWNKNAAGVPKKWAEIWKELGVELDSTKTDAVHTCGQAGTLVGSTSGNGARRVG